MSANENITVIGVGKLGICYCLMLEKAGYNVLGVEKFEERIELINKKLLKTKEPLVDDYLNSSQNFNCTNSIEEGIEKSENIFILVATPSLPNGRYDHSQIDSIVSELESIGKQKKTKNLVIVSTVMPGYCETLKSKLSDLNYTINYNPEFIAQGSVIHDQTNPDMILIGEANKKVGDKLEEIHSKVCHNNPKINRMDPLSAEITKLSLNCFLTTKISFANMIGDLAISAGADQKSILSAIGSDSRIGGKYLRYGYGYGGPCFPRDNRALSIYANDMGIDAMISKATDGINQNHLIYQVQKFMESHSKEETVVMEGVSYKPGSSIIEESQQLAFALRLVEGGYKVKIIDQIEVINQVKSLYGEKFIYQVLQ
tara:strand:+ start:2024 stop:3136 length:1113 start_codon:yes stop_codon:yes gene_type:complete